MQLISMSDEQTCILYERHMRRDFPPSELKSLNAILSMMQKDCYDVLGAYDDRQVLVAYALVFRPANGAFVLLDYLAVDEPLRGHGIGTELLKQLRDYYSVSFGAMIIECERPNAAPDEIEARKRIAFYTQAGAQLTNVRIWLFGVEYSILVLPCGESVAEQNWADCTLSIYRKMLPQNMFEQNVRLIRS